MDYYLELFQFNNHEPGQKDTIDIEWLFKSEHDIEFHVALDNVRRYAAILVQEYVLCENKLEKQTLFVVDAKRFGQNIAK